MADTSLNRLSKHRSYVSGLLANRHDRLTDTRGSEQFVDFYYKTFDADRTQLAALYV